MNKHKQIDTELLAKIFFPNHHQQVVAMEDKKIISAPNASVSGVIAFGKKPNLPGFQSISYGYVNNPNGSIRWLYPLDCKQPIFLRLYNGSGLRGKVFKLAFKAAFSLRNGRLLSSGRLHVFYKNQPLLNGLLTHCSTCNMAIFTGTVGENRKAVIAFDDAKGKRWFCKMPFSQEAMDLVENEAEALAKLAQLDLVKMQVPQAKSLANGLLVSDVKPEKAANSFDLQTLHFEAIMELSERTLEQIPLGSLPGCQEINENLEALQRLPISNELSPSKVQRVVRKLLRLRAALDLDLRISTAIAHGDFTPWNMYLGHNKLYVYDWELSERLPLLNDIFHFIFQSGILIKKLEYSKIESSIFLIKKNEKIQVFLKENNSDFELLYSLYLLRNISYYLLKYMRQNPLHQQAHWLLQAWDLALENAVKFQPRSVNRIPV